MCECNMNGSERKRNERERETKSAYFFSWEVTLADSGLLQQASCCGMKSKH